jgi:cell division protein FtsI (penicillin-binding protein 3)
MAQDIRLDVRDARDSLSILVPDVKSGNILAADYVLSHLGIKANTDWNGSYANGNPVWGHAQKHGNHSVTLQRLKVFGHTFVPCLKAEASAHVLTVVERL